MNELKKNQNCTTHSGYQHTLSSKKEIKRKCEIKQIKNKK